MTDAEALYVAVINEPGRLRTIRRLQYRCTAVDRCLLLDAIDTPLGVLLHQKRFKNSDALNQQRSNEAGRAKNTFDGDRHWKPRTFYIEQSALALDDADGATLEVLCDHVMAQIKPSAFAHDWTAGLAEVRVRADGTRYAVG